MAGQKATATVTPKRQYQKQNNKVQLVIKRQVFIALNFLQRCVIAAAVAAASCLSLTPNQTGVNFENMRKKIQMSTALKTTPYTLINPMSDTRVKDRPMPSNPLQKFTFPIVHSLSHVTKYFSSFTFPPILLSPGYVKKGFPSYLLRL